MQILHIADVHFDTSFGCKSARVRDALRSATRKAFTSAVDDALACDVDAVVIAGDLFDDNRLRLDTERFLLGALARLDDAGIPVVYATGNHDPAAPGTRFSAMQWPPNVTVVGSATPQVVTVPTPTAKLQVVAAGHESERELRNLAATFPRVDSPGAVVGLLHTNVERTGIEGEHHPYAPCIPADLDREDYSYWALGHIHVPGPVPGDTPAYYSGCLQGRHFRESGPRGGYLVTLEEGLPAQVTFRSYAPIQWHTVEIRFGSPEDGAGPNDVRGLDRLVDAAVFRLKAEYPSVELAVRVAFSGGTPLYEELRDPEQCAHLADAWASDFDLLYVEIESGATHAVLDLETVRSETSVLAEALELLDDFLLTPDAETLGTILPESALARDHNGLLEQLRARGESVRYELADRLLARESK